MEIEITEKVDLSVEELAKVELHTVINLLAVITANLIQLGDVVEQPKSFERTLNACKRLSDLTSTPKVPEVVERLSSIENMLEEDLDELVGIKPDIVINEEFQVSLDNIYSLLSILRIRGQEVYDRVSKPRSWIYYNIRDIQDMLQNFLTAVEKNSKGRYHIVSDPKKKGLSDYLVEIKITSVDGSIIHMPIAMPDVLRDLLANARKYTPPGGLLRLGVRSDGSNLKCMVEDTGIGIPEEEITKVVNFGARGSNIPRYQKQYGGGYGLTKAWVITNGASGKMWISSAPNHGTKITIDIPRPEEEESTFESVIAA